MENFPERFIKAVQERIPDSRCPLCKSSDWEVQPGVYRFRQGIKSQYGASYGEGLPSAALVCRVCGDVQFVSLLAYGDDFKRDI
jgi:hypothetical protein